MIPSTDGYLRANSNPDDTANSNAFKKNGKPDPEASVDLARLTNPRESLSRATNESFRLGIIKVRGLLALRLTVHFAPTVENPAHCNILGLETKDDCRALARIVAVLKSVEIDKEGLTVA